MEKRGSGALFAISIVISAIGLLLVFKSSAPAPTAGPTTVPPQKAEVENRAPSIGAVPAGTAPTSASSAPVPSTAPGKQPAAAPAVGVAATAPRTMPPPAAPDPDGPPPPAPPPPIPGNREQAQTVVSNVTFTVRDYRLRLGGNPVGNNEEITRALLGDNVKQVKFPIPEGSVLNGQGELCDPWGTPYFFHAVAKDRMEIRSAGADRKMWTPDDVQE